MRIHQKCPLHVQQSLPGPTPNSWFSTYKSLFGVVWHHWILPVPLRMSQGVYSHNKKGRSGIPDWRESQLKRNVRDTKLTILDSTACDWCSWCCDKGVLLHRLKLIKLPCLSSEDVRLNIQQLSDILFSEEFATRLSIVHLGLVQWGSLRSQFAYPLNFDKRKVDT